MVESVISKKFRHKFMRLAKTVGQDMNPCYSRQIGTVIADKYNRILSTGYNGNPRNTPHCDSEEYYRNFLYPKLSDSEKYRLFSEAFKKTNKVGRNDDEVIDKLKGCKTCPRKLLGYKSGERTDLCTCVHSERNAISNANCSLTNSILFAYCTVPCIQCTGAIINSLISEVHILDGPEYEKGCLYLFECAKIPIFYYKEEDFLI